MTQLRVLMLISAFFSAFMAQSQVHEQDSLAHQRIKLIQNNMYVLGAWASANIIKEPSLPVIPKAVKKLFMK